ncbi:MAG: hypothetical protein Q9169_001535 [Polycauliona sp. 2 TL-2023]
MDAQEGSRSAGCEASTAVRLPRIAIRYCTSCKWLLRAGWYAQELLSTFSTSIGEVTLVPATGGVFTVEIVHRSTASSSRLNPGVSDDGAEAVKIQLWDRKIQGGFPEIKELKRLVRDVVEPTRNLGHVDRHGSNLKADGGAESVNPNQPIDQSISTGRATNASNSALLEQSEIGSAQNEPPTTAELAASRTAEKMVADIMHNFQKQVKHNESSGHDDSLAGAKSDGGAQGAARSGDEEDVQRDGTHSARQGCEDCPG